MPSVRIGSLALGGGAPLLVIAGPCVIESEAHALETALALKAIVTDVGLPMVFKASYDKANRTSIGSFRGPGSDRSTMSRTGMPCSDCSEGARKVGAGIRLSTSQG